MINALRPAPGISNRWLTFLRGTMFAFGVVTLLGSAALLVADVTDPNREELRLLQSKIVCGTFT